MDKGRKLRKSDADMLNIFISGLPPSVSIFVRAGRVNCLREALQSAKAGEAHGYRQQSATYTDVPSSVPQVPQVSAAVGSVQSQLDNINKRLEEQFFQHHPSRGQTVSPRVCFRCKRERHIKIKCNWNGEGETIP